MMNTPAFLMQFEGVSTLRCVLLYRMLLCLNKFLNALYSLDKKMECFSGFLL